MRLTFTASPEVQERMTTLEAAEADEGRAEFLNYDNVTKINAALFDHTEGPETHYSMRLNGPNQSKVVKTKEGLAQGSVRAERLLSLCRKRALSLVL